MASCSRYVKHSKQISPIIKENEPIVKNSTYKKFGIKFRNWEIIGHGIKYCEILFSIRRIVSNERITIEIRVTSQKVV